ncbi:MAG: methionyl-tRNA formyltransferase [Eubacterium sp.]|nr:methionyl-tRNA formyltransferase [Eubacterium sp.]
MRVIFMGTPDFSVPILESIAAAGHEVVLTVTQPDRHKGRHGHTVPSPVKECALKLDIPVYTPEKVSTPEGVEYLKGFDPDIMVVAAYGQILSKEILDLPRTCCVNVHASLLPAYRGASPIQWAVINGEEYSGVTTMRMEEGLDTGDIIEVSKIKLADNETAGSLFDRLSGAGAQLIVSTLEKIGDGTATFTPQGDDGVTYTRQIKKSLGDLDFSKSAVELSRLVRGLDPWPGAFTRLNGKNFKILKVSVAEGQTDSAPGTIVSAGRDGFLVATGDGLLALEEVQLEGKKRMSAEDFLRGVHPEEGTLLG